MHFTYNFTQPTCEVHTSYVQVQPDEDIHITLVDGPFEHFFLLVKDPEQRLRALFTWKSRIRHYGIYPTVGDNANLTLPGPMSAGKWEFTVVKPGKLQGQATIEVSCTPSISVGELPKNAVLDKPHGSVVNAQHRWYRGDLHAHSLYSDGRVTLEDIVQSAQRQQLDFLAITDHSVVTTYAPPCPQLIIPATELTFDNELHYNVFGVHELIDYSQYLMPGAEVTDIITRLHGDLTKAGNLIAINHPFAQGISLGHDFDMRWIHLLEVINAPHLEDQPIDNEKAIRFFDFLWLKGFHIFATGGSDAHKPNKQGIYPLGRPTTSVYCEGLSINNVIDGLRHGRAFISDAVSCSLNIEQNGTAVLPGSQIDGPATFRANCADQTLVWRLMCNGACIHEQIGRLYEHTIQPESISVIRLEARLGQRTVFFANPIYRGCFAPNEFRFSTLLNEFLAQDSGAVC